MATLRTVVSRATMTTAIVTTARETQRRGSCPGSIRRRYPGQVSVGTLAAGVAGLDRRRLEQQPVEHDELDHPDDAEADEVGHDGEHGHLAVTEVGPVGDAG